MKHKALFTAVSLAFMAIACSDDQTAQSHLERALQYQVDNNYSASIIELKNALVLEPKNGEARYQLGNVYLLEGNGAAAKKELERAKTLKYDSRKLIPKLARAYFLNDDFEEILSLFQEIKDSDKEAQVEYLAYRTIAALALERLAIAEQAASEAVYVMKDSVYTMLAKAYLEFAKNNIVEAELYLNKAIALNAKHPEALMLQARIAVFGKNYQQASEAYKQYLVVQPEANLVYLLVAETLLNAERYAEAEEYADTILKVLPEQSLANYVKSAVAFQRKDYINAKQYAERSATISRDHLPTRLIAGASSFYLANYEQASYHLAPVVKHLQASHPAQKMYVVSRFNLGLVEDIADIYEDYQPNSEQDSQFLSALSFNLYSVGAVEEAKQLAKKSLSNSNKKAEDLARKGLLKLMLNDADGIIDLENALAKQPELTDAEFLIAYAAIQAKDYSKALQIAEKWQQKESEKAAGYNLAAAVYIQQGNFDVAKDILKQSLTKETNNIYALTEMAKIAYQQESYDVAQDYINKALTRSPDSAKVLRYNFAINSDQQALSKIAEAFDRNPDNHVIKQLYAQALIKQQEFSEAYELLNSFVYSITTPRKTWQLKLIAQQELGLEQQYRGTLEQWLEVNPYHVEPTILLASLYSKFKATSKALEYVNRALSKYHSESIELQLLKTQLLIDSRAIEQAKSAYDSLKDKGVDANALALLDGQIRLLEQDFKSAVPMLEQAYKNTQSSRVALMLSLALSKTENTERAIELLESHLTTDENEVVQAFLANLYLTVDKSGAMKTYSQLVERNPKNALYLNNLAWLTMEKGDFVTARKYSEQAYELAPNVANVADTYSQILLKLDDKVKSLETAKIAYEISNGADTAIALNYAEVLVANDKIIEARSVIANLDGKTEADQNRISQLNRKIN